jgi:hypothetical protein
MAGINIVSAYITIVAMQLSIASTFHAEAGTLTESDEEREEECKLEAESLPLVFLVFLVFL